MDDGKAQTGAFGFCRVERQKDFRQIVLVSPGRSWLLRQATTDALPFTPAEFFDGARNCDLCGTIARCAARLPAALRSQVYERLSNQKSLIAGQIVERAFAFHFALRNGFAKFFGHALDQSLHGHRFVGNLQRFGEAQKLSDHVRKGTRLIEDALCGFTRVSYWSFAADHLRVARK